MHYYALVEIPEDTTDIHAAVGAVMQPHEESCSEQDDSLAGFWDCWSIGGRWTGYLSDYDPLGDRRNMAVCFLCSGTGKRTDELGALARLNNPKYGCNGCDDTGIEFKHASQWVLHGGDVVHKSDVPDDKTPYTLVTADGAFHKEIYDHKTRRFEPGGVAEAWAALAPTARLVIVDYHR